jgi:hypothetical protein
MPAGPCGPISEPDAERGTRAASAEDFEALTADFPADSEGLISGRLFDGYQ